MSLEAFDPDKPWERQPFDTAEAWAWFSDFLSQGPGRRLSTLAKKTGCPWTWSGLEQVAHDCAWKERARAWDAHLEALRVDTVERHTRETAREQALRHSQGARLAYDVSIRELEKLRKAGLGDGIGLLTPAEARRMLEMAVKLERLIMGEVTERVDQGPDLGKLSIDDLRALKAMAERAA